MVRADRLPVASVFVVQTNLLQTDGGGQVTVGFFFCSDQLWASCAWGAPVVPAGLEEGAALDSGGQIVMRMGTVGAMFEGRF